MEQLYDRADIYDLLNNPRKDAITKEHWRRMLEGKNIRTLLDVSIGSGNLTLPIGQLGIELYGSDLSQAMLDKCRKNAEAQGVSVNLRNCDFRHLTDRFSQQFDCVASTGNSLAYVNNSEVCDTLSQMDALVKLGGYLYFDLRNWDKIQKCQERFYLYNPAFDGDTRVNLVQVWDHLPDGTIDFNLLFTFERDNRIFQKEHFVEHYHPVSRSLLLDKLATLGYQEIQTLLLPTQFGDFQPKESDWYCVIARKKG